MGRREGGGSPVLRARSLPVRARELVRALVPGGGGTG